MDTPEAVIVTGARGGLGQATTAHFAQSHQKVIALDIDATLTPESDRLDNVIYADVDIRLDDEVSRTIYSLAKEHAITGLVHCAGITGFSPSNPGHLVSPETGEALDNFALLENVVDTNLLGTLSVVRHSASCMSRNDFPTGRHKGVIVLTSSGAAFDGKAGQSAYTSSKAGVAGMTLPLAREFSPHRIRVTCIAPGLFDTPILNDTPRLERHVPFPNRKGRPTEFAELAGHIFDNEYINADVFRIDGGIRGAFQHHDPFTA